MKSYIIPFSAIVLCSCILYGSGIKTVTGTLSGGLLTGNEKVGLFADDITFLYDNFNSGDPDVIDREKDDGDGGTYVPVVLGSFDTLTTYSIVFPDDPSTIKSLVAWDDNDLDGSFDLDGTEIAYFPVKTVDSVDYVVHHFGYIALTEEITYFAVYRNLDSTSIDFDTLYTDDFDAIGAGDFDFTFD